VLVRLDMDAIGQLQLAIDAHSVKFAILTTPKMKLKPDAVRVVAGDTLIVSPPDTSRWVGSACGRVWGGVPVMVCVFG
jgi:hypothetical protein